MSNQSQSKQNATEPEPLGFAGVVVRIFWLMGGNIALFILAVFILEKKTASILDIAYWAIVIGLILIRYVDITRLKGLTSNSEPATLKHWRIYVVKLLLISGALWGLARIIPLWS